MTLIELLVFALWIGLAAVVGCLMGARFGVVSGVLGFLGGFAATYVIARLLSRLVGAGFRATTRCLRCREVAVAWTISSITEAGLEYGCPCGARYLHTRRRLMVMGATGEWVPFKMRRPLGRWVDERAR